MDDVEDLIEGSFSVFEVPEDFYESDDSVVYYEYCFEMTSDGRRLIDNRIESEKTSLGSSHPTQYYNCVPNPKYLCLKLTKRHSLWGHLVWNSGRVIADLINSKSLFVAGKTVLEFGAGSALPSIVAALSGASKVVACDWPEPEVLQSIVNNVCHNVWDCRGLSEDSLENNSCDHRSRFQVLGHKWGSDTRDVMNCLHSGCHCFDSRVDADHRPGFDIIILADLVFNHTCHLDLLKSVFECLASDGTAIVGYSHHRTTLIKEDNAFLELARQSPFNFLVRPLPSVHVPPMFPDDEGDRVLRGTVLLFEMIKKTIN